MKTTRSRVRDGIYTGGAALLALVALPLLAALAFVARAGILAAAILAVLAGVVAYVVSPAFREWLAFQDEPELRYKGLRLATDVDLHPGHAWARIDSGEATVGADDLVASLLGPADAVDLPLRGSRVLQDEPLFTLRRGSRRVALRAPLSGRVVDVNDDLREIPELAHNAPFDSGWAVRLEPERRRRERRRLRRGGTARTWFRGEVDRLLSHLLPAGLAPTLPDGGVVVGELHQNIDDATWERIEAELLDGAMADRPVA